MFSTEDIVKLSTGSSFSRGEDYYESGHIEKITRAGNSFEGTVSGSFLYKVTLDMENGNLDFNCSCPYDYGGLCKHEVAFALAILNGEYTEKIEIKSDSLADKEEFRKCFKNTDQWGKLSFLKQLLDKDSDLQNQFVSFIKSESEDLDKITGINIDEIKETVYKQLASIDFDYIVENHDPYYGSYYDDEGYFETANDEISNVFLPYKNKAIEYVKKGNLQDAVRIMFGLYEGVQNLPGFEDNEYEIFYESYDEIALGLLRESFNEITGNIDQIVIANECIHKVLDLFFQRYEHLESNFSDIDEEGDEILIYILKHFEKLFLSLITNKKTAGYLYKIIRESGLECLDMAFVLLKIAEVTEDEKMWIETAEKFTGFDQKITKQLLEKYKLKNQEKDFNRIAELAFSKWAGSFDFYLINNLKKESKKELYIKALRTYTANKQSIVHYNELREYLNEAQKKEFADEIKKGYHEIFFVQLLETEKRHEDILVFAREKKAISYNFANIIAPIKNIYPDECFNMIRDKCTAALNEYNRNRKTYQQMVEWLEVMSQIESKQQEAKQYIKTLYEHKPNLPALKDEIRKAQLI
jgi:hypothetical protein